AVLQLRILMHSAEDNDLGICLCSDRQRSLSGIALEFVAGKACCAVRDEVHRRKKAHLHAGGDAGGLRPCPPGRAERRAPVLWAHLSTATAGPRTVPVRSSRAGVKAPEFS